jgi:hypothetical protein
MRHSNRGHWSNDGWLMTSSASGGGSPRSRQRWLSGDAELSLRCMVLDRTRGKKMSRWWQILPVRSLRRAVRSELRQRRWHGLAGLWWWQGVALTILRPPNLVEGLCCKVLVLLLGSNPAKRWWINAHEDLPWRLVFKAFRVKFDLLQVIFIGVLHQGNKTSMTIKVRDLPPPQIYGENKMYLTYRSDMSEFHCKSILKKYCTP